MRTPHEPGDVLTSRRGPIGVAVRRRDPPTRRTILQMNSISVWGWPSRGGLITLDYATVLDFEFLGLDLRHPCMRRNPNQDAEDAFCQRLLLLGAKWFDSRARRDFICGLEEDEEADIKALENGEAEKPTIMERRWISVSYPGGVDAGLWVVEHDTVMYGVQEKHNLVPSDAGKVQLAKTMGMKCEILKSMGAKFYASIGEYDGPSCLNAWEKKTEGEVGPLIKTQWEEGYGNI